MSFSSFQKSKQKDADKVLALAAKEEKKIKRSFFIAIAQLKSDIEMAILEDAIAAKNLELAVRASKVNDLPKLLNGIGIDHGELVFSDEVINSFNDGAALGASFLPLAAQKAVSYSPLGERTVQFLRSYGAVMVREITDSTRQGVNTALVRGFNEGSSPKKQAREIRQLVGLTGKQTEAVINFRQQLEQRLNNPIDSFGKPRSMTPAFSRRLSGPEQSAVRGHMKNGTFDQDKIDSMVNRYYESLQNKRANDIARTEALKAVNNGQMEIWTQAVEQGALDPNTTRKFWIVTPDDKLRKDHAAIPVMNPKGVPVPAFFQTPFGPVKSPGDDNSNLINCRCVIALGGI